MAIKERNNREFDYHLTQYKRSTPQIEETKAVINLLKSNLRTNLPQLIPIMNSFDFVPVKEKVLMVTDGLKVYYNPVKLMLKYNRGSCYELEYRLLHMLIHGILGHFERSIMYSGKRLMWGLMDIQAFDMISKLSSYYSGHRMVSNDGVEQALGRIVYSPLYKDKLQGDSLYHVAKGSRALALDILTGEKGVRADDHRYWGKDVLGSTEKASMDNLENAIKEMWENARVTICQITGVSDVRNALLMLGGSKIAFGHQAGDLNVCVTPKEEGDRGVSYQQVIKELIRERELVVLDEDSIDSMLYTYGMDMYGDMPLVEPREDNEVSYIDSLVIAIDTSGSCNGDIASMFLRETYELFRELKETVRFGNVHLIQCDYEIQEELCLNHDDIDFLGEDMEFKGFGGTSFVPVFDRIAQLKDQGENVQGLIYLTDACGEFPDYKPDYPVYFVVPKEWDSRENYYSVDLPEWVRLIDI
ncbi:MAG: hypothetical protein IJX85_06480 [Lachnospiraceae bacterium]|nr:hypothetical protein [Lachnospiraceae bacterium]